MPTKKKNDNKKPNPKPTYTWAELCAFNCNLDAATAPAKITANANNELS